LELYSSDLYQSYTQFTDLFLFDSSYGFGLILLALGSIGFA
jgi:hypothetical protein